jgi:phage/plasmid primase-like uncharacterized protein
MTMEEQMASHLKFLKDQSVSVEELQIDAGYVRCHSIDETDGRGELCYWTKQNQLNNGMIGLISWCRGKGGKIKIHKTYGYPPNNTNSKNINEARRAEFFWQMSNSVGESEYLLKKGVGYHGIRFRSTEYGKIAIIPMRDINGKLLSYQILNSDGTKKFCKNTEIKGLFHILHTPIKNFPIGIAESYVTAASCFELTGVSMVTAFTANNLKEVAQTIRKKFPDNHIIIFGDNDRHLEENVGVRAAYEAKEKLGKASSVAIPKFDGYQCLKELSDWNDLVREIGIKQARLELRAILAKN